MRGVARWPENRGAPFGGTAWSRAFLSCAVAAGLLGLACIVMGVRSGTQVNHVAATWTAIAADMSQGLFYRPLYSPEIGYGGTRFFPLFFSLQALLIKSGLTPIVAGHVVGLLSGGLLLGGAYVLLRRLSVSRTVAAGVTALLLASGILQHGFATIRGDILPLALNVWGFAAYLGARNGRSRLAVPALLFTLAFAAKATAFHGVVAMGLWLLVQGRRRDAAAIAGLAVLGCSAVLAVTQVASAGRFLGIMRACATGGATLGSVLEAPRNLAGMFLWKEPWGFCLFGAACLACLGRFRSCARTLPGIFLAASLGATVVVFGSPGVTWNHLADLVVASALLLGVAVGQAPPAQRRVLEPALLLLAVFAVLPGIATVRQERAAAGQGADQERRAVAAAMPPGPGAILSEDPLLPIVAGERPYLLDAFMVRLVAERDPQFAVHLTDRVRAGTFRAIVFLNDPRTRKSWYETVHFGPEVMRIVDENYEPRGQVGRYFIYERRRNLPATDDRDGPGAAGPP